MALAANGGGLRPKRPPPPKRPFLSLITKQWPGRRQQDTIAEDSSVIRDPLAYWGRGAKDTIADYAGRRWQVRQQDTRRDELEAALQREHIARGSVPKRSWPLVDWQDPWWRPPESELGYQRQVLQGYGFAPEAQAKITQKPLGQFRWRATEALGFDPQVARNVPSWQKSFRLDPVAFTVEDLTSRAGGGGWAPWFGEVSLQGANDEAAVHELTHAWADMVGLWDKEGHNLEFRRAVQRLVKEPDPRYSRAAQIAYAYEHGWGDWPGMGDNDPERFAGLASGVMGDISQLPPYVSKFYKGLFTGQGARVGLKAPESQMTRAPRDLLPSVRPPPVGAPPMPEVGGGGARPWFPQIWKR